MAQDSVLCLELLFNELFHEKDIRLPPVEEVKTSLAHTIHGMLSTFSQKHEGYPSGSMVDFACDANGSPILAVSNLAIHTKDLVANPKCSLLVTKYPEDVTDLLISLHGDAVSVPETETDAVRHHIWQNIPKHFGLTLVTFNSFAWAPKVMSFVSGATALLSGGFTNKEFKQAKVDQIYQFSKPISSHMNKDHANDTKLIVQHSTSIPAGYQDSNFKLRIPFPRRAEERKVVKTLIIEMLQAAKS